MTVAHRPLFAFDENTFVRDLAGLYEPWQAEQVPAPELAVLDEEVAREVGVDPDALRSPEGVAVLAGNLIPEGATPVAQGYAGHQFGGFSPRLGDGRALLLGEVVDVHGRRRDIHLKGSGRTPFSRGGDGKAVLGPMLREHVISHAMRHLGIPTTRALAVVTTGERIARDRGFQPGAVLVRVAASHLRVGTFQYAATRPEPDLLPRLAEYAIARHHPDLVGVEGRHLALLERVVDAQASLVASWMHIGFIHGVMNTDNTTISGETIDYGPCAFMDAFDPATVFSSIDHGGRYSYGNQPAIMQWNLARLAEAMLPLLGSDTDQAVVAATEVLRSFADRYTAAWTAGMRAKLGLTAPPAGDGATIEQDATLIEEYLQLLQAGQVDHTGSFRALAAWLRTDGATVPSAFASAEGWPAWSVRWRERVTATATPDVVADGMDRTNPVYVPRNHLVEEALEAAVQGDMGPYHRLVDVLSHPFEQRPGLERYAEPAPGGCGLYQTFCGT